jgi:hypothetical protein
MPLDLPRLAELRRALAAQEAALDQSRAAIHATRAAVHAARRANDTAAVKEQRAALKAAVERWRRRRARRAAILEEIEALRRAGEAELAAPEARLDGRGADLPVLLLPLRIETRFLPVDGPPAELVVRIYPDEVHVDDHDAALTSTEEDGGREYWRAVWRAGPGSDGGAPWERLRDIHGGPRAGWIVRSTEPLNSADRPGAPTDEGAPLQPEPRFPDPPARPEGSARATRVAWLPDRFAVVGYVAGAPAATAWSELVAEELLAAPLEDPVAQDADPIGPGADVDELDVPELDWLMDIDAAVAAGMAIRLPLDDRIRGGFERLVVVGVRTDGTVETLADDLERLLETHAHTSGVEISVPGRATNDAAGPPPVPPPLLHPPELAPESAGGRLATALGLAPARLAAVPGAEQGDPARAMNALLWPSTLGYYLEQLALPALDDGAIDATRRWFINHVRGRGPLPTLIVGAQPYGVLPVTVAGRLRPEDAFAGELAALLGRLRGWWREAVSRVPRLGRTGDPEADLNEVLGQGPVMQRLRIREGFGRHYLENLYRHPGGAAPIAGPALDQQRLVAGALLSTLSERRLEARIAEIALRMRSNLFRAPLVAATPSGDRLEEDYLGATRAALTGASPASAAGALPGDGPLLRRLARHGALLSLGDGSGRVLRDVRGLPSRVLMEAELVDVERRQDTRTTTRRLGEQVTIGGATTTAVDVLIDGARQAGLGRMDAVVNIEVLDELVRSDAHRRHAALLEYEWALARLATESSASLDLLLREGLDTVSHRLDAWLSSFAWKRLLDQRVTTPAGVHMGAYGIVENLRPAPRLQPSPGEPGLFEDAGAGYVHAPSLDQAAAAAVLRAGYVAHGRGEAFAVDLSSARVRAALGVVDAVRAGHALAAVLGYRFERRLHELGLDRYVPVFREVAPLHGESGAAESEVADGLALRTRFANRALLAEHRLAGAAPDDSRFEREPTLDSAAFVRVVGGLIDELDDLVDAVSDLMLADAAHASVQGNPARARAIADAARSGTLPPEPEVTRTPRTGVAFMNRIAVAMNRASGPAPGWPRGSRRARQIAEPRLDRWAGAVLGDPSTLVQRLRVVSPAGDETTVTVSVADLQIGALDVLYGVRGAGSSGRGELDERFVSAAEGVAAVDGATIEPTGDPRWRVLATELHSLLASARPLAPPDLGPAGEAPGTMDEAEWAQRAGAVREELAGAVDTLDRTLAAADTDGMLAAAARLSDFGLVDGIGSARATDPAAAAADVLIDARLRLDRDDGAKPAGERIAGLLGADFRSVPLVTAARRRELAATLERSTGLQGGDPLAAAGWLAGVGRVRPEADRLARVMALGDALAGAGPRLAVGQLPHDPHRARRWIGLGMGSEAPPVQVALVISSADHLDPTGPLAGLLVDEWPDVVPRADETTAVALHFDRPSTEAPNCALLAVHPGDREAWDLATLTETVVEAVELARLRAVDLQSLHMVGRVLPATYLPRNVTGDTTSFDFAHVDFDAGVFADP